MYEKFKFALICVLFDFFQIAKSSQAINVGLSWGRELKPKSLLKSVENKKYYPKYKP